MRIDRFSMANSVEARVPFLDPFLVDFVYRLPLQHKMAPGRSKVVLREAIGDLVPDWVLRRPKQGFGAPVDDWLQSHLGLLVEKLVETEAVQRYFDPSALLREVAYARRGRVRIHLWPVINFALWHRHWIERESIEELVPGELDPSEPVLA